MATGTLETTVTGHETDPDYELSWDSLSELLKLDHPLHDLVTDVIDNYSDFDRKCIRLCLAYKNSFAPVYNLSRNQWITTAMKLQGRKLEPDEMTMVADKHRIYFAVTHPRQMNVHIHNAYEENVVADFLVQVREQLGLERCRELGYRFHTLEFIEAA